MCLKQFSIRLEAIFKQQNPGSNHEDLLNQHGFWLKFFDVIGHCEMTFCVIAESLGRTLKAWQPRGSNNFLNVCYA